MLIFLLLVIDKELHFQILSQKASDNSTKSPFNFTSSAKSINIYASVGDIPEPEGQLYYDLLIEVRDNANHSIESSVKIVVMTNLNNITFGFDSSREEIDRNKETIFDILNREFDWSFSSKGIKDSSFRYSEGGDAGEAFTTLEGYFVDQNDNFKPKSQAEIATKYDLIFDDLNEALKTELNISLDSTQG